MDINKIRDAMKVLKEKCKMNKACQDCIFYEDKTENFHCYLTKEPASWEEDEIVENNCTCVQRDDIDKWCEPVLRCKDCDAVFMLRPGNRNNVVGKFCPHCGKKIVNYKEEDE